MIVLSSQKGLHKTALIGKMLVSQNPKVYYKIMCNLCLSLHGQKSLIVFTAGIADYPCTNKKLM